MILVVVLMNEMLKSRVMVRPSNLGQILSTNFFCLILSFFFFLQFSYVLKNRFFFYENYRFIFLCRWQLNDFRE